MLEPGETILAAVRAQPPSARPGSLESKGPIGYALAGGIDRALATAAQQRRDPKGFPLAPDMAIAVTDRRFIVWEMRGVLGMPLLARPHKVRGILDLSDVENVEFSRRTGRLSLWLASRSLELEVPIGHEAAAQQFAVTARERIAALR